MNDRQALQEVKKLFKDNLFERTVLSKRGKLDTNRLSFYKTSPRIFAEKNNRSGKKYSIEVVIDGSGSMFDRKLRDAFNAAQNIVSVLQYVCPINIRVFNYLEKSIPAKEFMRMNIQEFKKICQRSVYIHDIDGNKHFLDKKEGAESCYGDATGGNWEIINIHNAVESLMQKPGGKIVMILQDGCPSACGEGTMWMAGKKMKNYPISSYKKWIKKFEKMGVDIVSFGICTEDPKKYFDKFYLLNNSNEAYSAMVKYLKTIIVN